MFTLLSKKFQYFALFLYKKRKHLCCLADVSKASIELCSLSTLYRSELFMWKSTDTNIWSAHKYLIHPQGYFLASMHVQMHPLRENYIINMFSDCLTSVKHDDHVCVHTWTPTTAFPTAPGVHPECTTQPNMVIALYCYSFNSCLLYVSVFIFPKVFYAKPSKLNWHL